MRIDVDAGATWSFGCGCYDGESLEQCKWIKLCGGRRGIDRSSSPYLQRSPMHLVVELQPTFCMHNPPHIFISYCKHDLRFY